MWRWLTGFFIKDAKLFCADRQAVVMAFVIPLLIASILGWLDSSADTPGQKIPILIVDQDGSAASKALLDRLGHSDLVSVSLANLDQAKKEVAKGEVPAVAILPKGFGAQGTAALTGGPKPVVQLLTDPSQPQAVQIAKGVVIADASGALATSAFGGLAGNGEAPLRVEEHEAAAKSVPWGKAAHDYAGFGLQGLLFFAVEAAAALSRERRQGIWRRIRSAPVPPWVLVLSKGINSAILALGIVLTLFLVGALLFGIRLEGSVPGFFLIAIASALIVGAGLQAPADRIEIALHRCRRQVVLRLKRREEQRQAQQKFRFHGQCSYPVLRQ